METHKLHEELSNREVRLLVVGCGGTGTSIMGGLPYIHQAMLVQGHPYGLHVTVMDADTVSPFNCVRQPFSRGEIGLYKGVVMVNRINLFWGLNWKAIPRALTAQTLATSYAGSGEATCARTSWWVVWTRGRHAPSSPRALKASARRPTARSRQ